MSSVLDSDRGHPRLATQPVVEAVFELRGKNAKPFTLLPGQFVAALAERYPLIEETETAKIAGMTELPQEAGLFVTHKLTSADRRDLVQLGATGFSVNSSSYSGFGEFRAAVSRVLRVYLELDAVRKIERLGLRYINFVEPGASYFSNLSLTVQWPDLPGGEPEGVAVRALFRYNDPVGELAVAVGGPDPRGTLLDLDFFSKQPETLAADDILSWFDRAHERVYEAFRWMVRPEIFTAWERVSSSEVG